VYLNYLSVRISALYKTSMIYCLLNVTGTSRFGTVTQHAILYEFSQQYVSLESEHIDNVTK